MARVTVDRMYEAAVEAVEHVSQANWSEREDAAKRYLFQIASGETNADLDRIQGEVNEE